MNFRFIQGVLTLFLGLLASVDSRAANGFTCSIVNPTSITFTIPYAFGGSTNYVGRTIPVTCTRAGNTNNAESVTVYVGITNGGNASGAQNNAAGAGLINYDFYTTPGNTCGAEVTPTSTTNLFATVAFGSGLSTANANTNTVYACVPPPALNANGPYSDNATAVITLLTPSNSGGALTINPVTATLRVDIAIPQRCAISTPIGALTFDYTSFSTTAIQATKTYSVTCGVGLTAPVPTMALTDSTGQPLTSGTAAGLAYTLALNTSTNLAGGTPTLTVAPGGSTTTYRINGNMVAGQAGSCAAPATLTGTGCTQTITGTTGHYITVTW